MPKRRPKKIFYKADAAARLRKTLSERTKRELMDALVELAGEALPKSDLPPGEIVAWCKTTLASDRVGCIYDRELRALQCRFEASAP